ncbi:MAG: LptF/LptG family permease [Candidatus Omnitrophica bacterium]|nr:LptF/LptG family permease [Candidatus Omnitrophota bacterium]
MRILDKYITRSIIQNFFLILLIFAFIYILIDITTNLEEIISFKVPMTIMLTYYTYFVPTMMIQVIPIACLLACIFTYSQLNSHNEIIAMRASGLNFWQISRPAMLLSVLVAILIFFANERFIPNATIEGKKIQLEYLTIKSDPTKQQKENIKNLTFYGLQNRLYFIDSFDTKTFDLTGITIIENDAKQNIKQKISALNGIWTGIAWKFTDCQISLFDENLQSPSIVKIYKEKLMDIKETPEDFLKQRVNVQVMNIKQLSQYIERFAHSGATRALENLKVDLFQKFAYPMMNIVLVLVGMPFALLVRGRRGSTFACFGIALLIGFLYYVVNAVTLALGKGGAFPPIVAAFCTPVVFALGAFYLIEEKF